MHLPSDAEMRRLIRAAQRRVPQAWAQLYNLFAEPLFRFCFYHEYDVAMARDLVRSLFHDLIELIQQFQLPKRAVAPAFVAWLFDRAASQLASAEHRATPALLERAVGQSDPVVETADHTVPIEPALQHHLRSLTPQQRQVVILRFVERLSTADTAAITGQTMSDVRALQQHALASIASTR